MYNVLVERDFNGEVLFIHKLNDVICVYYNDTKGIDIGRIKLINDTNLVIIIDNSEPDSLEMLLEEKTVSLNEIFMINNHTRKVGI